MPCACERILFAAVLVGAIACDRDAGDDRYVDDGTSGDESTSDDGSSSDEAGSSEGATRDPTQWETLAERPCPDDSALTWENFGGPYVLTYCSGCHHSGLPAGMRQDAPVEIDLESVALVREHAERVWARAADQNATMPPAGAPGPDERALLGEWLACGAPTNADLGILE